MSTISLITILFFLSSLPTYTEIIQDKPPHPSLSDPCLGMGTPGERVRVRDIFFYRQKGSIYSVTNLSSGEKAIGIKTRWGDCYIKIFKIDTKNLILAVSEFEDIKKLISQNRFDQDDYKYYENILDNSSYSDSLAYIFLCWRTAYQVSNHGVSNYSYIPNAFYNKKKRMVINRLKAYLKSHPGSTRAVQQIAYLENLSDIVRGGFMGNSVLNDLAFLHTR